VRDRLTAAAVLGGLRQRAWSLLIVSAFLVLSAAGAAGPIFAEASDNAAFRARLDDVPATARQTDAAVVRISANVGPGSADQQQVIRDVRTIPGLSEPDLTGGSVGAELVAPRFWSSTVTAGTARERGRLFAVADPATDLVAVGKPDGKPDEKPDEKPDGKPDGRRDGVWLPEPMARELAVRAGGRIDLTVVIGTNGKPHRATIAVSGVYAVDAGGRLPADPPGSRQWTLRQGDTPGDTEYRTLPAYLLVGDIATVERVAAAVRDQLFWSVEAALAPGRTMAGAQRTADVAEAVRRDYATQEPPPGDAPQAFQFASGIGRIVATARATTETVRKRTRPVEWAAIGVGLASVLAVALLSARRREREVRHAVAAGIPPVRVGGLWLLEHLLPAVLGAALGWLIAWQLVARLGPPGRIEESLVPALTEAALAASAGLLAVAAVGFATAARRVRPAPPAAVRRQLPWAAMVVIVALVAAGSLVTAGGTAGGTDLLVPLLVLAAAGVIAGRLPGLLAGGARLPASPRRAVLWLARRRLTGGGTERRLAVAVVAAGLGMLLFGVSAVESTAVTADDRVAVAAGAEGVAVLEGSWELDAAAMTRPPDDQFGREPDAPPGVRTPPLPAGNTVVWRGDVTTLLDDDQKDLLIVDPARFREVALWGRGDGLAAARAAVTDLAAHPVDADGRTPRTIVVGDPTSAQVDVVRVNVSGRTEDLAVASRVPAFPGMQGRPMFVVAADPMFARFQADDPRLKPRTELPVNELFLRTMLWSSAGADGIQAITTAKGVQAQSVNTAAQLRQDAAYIATGRARGYQLAIAGYLALLAILTLCIYAQRSAVQRRPADLMLARIGLGRARVRQARALEFVLLAVVAFGAAVAGVAVLAPLGGRLLDDQPGLLPAFAFRLSPYGLGVTAAAAATGMLLAVVLARAGAVEEDAYRDD
jgi:hypothetical protein